MNAMVRLVLCVTLIPLASAAAQPQGRARPDAARAGQRPIMELRQALQSVELSEDQRAELRQIMQSVPEKLRALNEQTQDMDPRQRVARVREFQQELREQVLAKLSDAQRRQVEEQLSVAREARRQAPGAQRNRPAEPPPGGATPRGERGAGEMVDRLREALKSAELSDAQKVEVDRIIGELRDNLVEIRASAAGDRQAAMTKAREAFRAARDQIVEQLTDQQRQALRQAMRDAGPGDGPRRLREPDPMNDAGAPPATQPTTQPTASAVGGFVLPQGSAAPEWATTDLSGRPVRLESLKRRPTVMIFGSFSLPLFRQKAQQANQLREDLGTQGQVYVVYTREAHAKGEWEVERNRDEKISVAQPADATERIAAARQAIKSLKLDVPVLVDDMSDATLLAYGNHPGGCAVIDADRRIVAHFRSFDAYAVRRALDR